MIITVTTNPAIDKTAEVDSLRVGGLNRLRNITLDASGKGVNVSKMIAALGGDSLAMGFAGGESGAQLLRGLDALGIAYDFIPVDDNVRINLKVRALDGSVTELNEPGLAAAPVEMAAFTDKLLAASGPDTLVVLSGSIPRDASPTLYRDLTNALHAKGARVFVDADGATFRHALEASPDFIKPNLEELAAHFGVSPDMDMGQLRRLCEKLLAQGVKLVTLSMGGSGALFVSPEATFHAPGLSVEVLSTVGAGDCMVGALAYGLDKAMTLEDTAILAIAASAGSVTTPGTRPPALSVVEGLKGRVKLARLA